MDFYIALTPKGWKRFAFLKDAKESVLESSRANRNFRYPVCVGMRDKRMVCYALGGELYRADGYLYERSGDDDIV